MTRSKFLTAQCESILVTCGWQSEESGCQAAVVTSLVERESGDYGALREGFLSLSTSKGMASQPMLSRGAAVSYEETGRADRTLLVAR